MKLNNGILKNWIEDKSRNILGEVDSQIMWLDNREEMENIVFSDDVVDRALLDLKEQYDCSDYDDFDIVVELRRVQHERISKYLIFLGRE